MFCLLVFCLLRSFLLIGAPTSSGGVTLLFKLLVLGLFVFWLGLFDSCFLSFDLKKLLVESLVFTWLFIFFGFAISWIGGFAGLLLDEVVLFRKVFLFWLEFWVDILFVFLFTKFPWDCERLIILGLLGFLGGFEVIFRFSGLLRGFINNGLLLELSLTGFPFPEGITEDSFSLCFSKLLFLMAGLLMESIFLSELFLLMWFFIFFASSALIELLWLFTEIESFWAASNISLFSRFKSLESS